MKDVIHVAVVNSVQKVPKIGEEKEQFKNFVKVTDPLKKNKQQKDPFKGQS